MSIVIFKQVNMFHIDTKLYSLSPARNKLSKKFYRTNNDTIIVFIISIRTALYDVFTPLST